MIKDQCNNCRKYNTSSCGQAIVYNSLSCGMSLYFLALVIPMVLHGVYDTFCDSSLCFIISVPVMIVSVILLMTYLKQGVNYQSKLRN